MVDIKHFDYVEDGRVAWPIIVDNFAAIKKTVGELEDDVKFLFDNQSTVTRTLLVESEAVYTLMERNDHPTGRIIEAFIMAGDNIKEEQTIRIVNGNKDLVERKTLKSTEKSGKIQSMEILRHQKVHRIDEVKVMSTSHRKTTVTIVFKGEK